LRNSAGFTGYRYEAITGLYHVRFRDFDPFRGRWLQRDPAGYMDSNNLTEAIDNMTGTHCGRSPMHRCHSR
jgi:RHS repeat-associated protein